MTIKVFTKQVLKDEIAVLAKDSYGDMVKGVVDIEKGVLALGGELHADAEEILLDQGSKQENLWGFNLFLNKSRDEYLEYTSLINIRPRQGNMSREISDINLCKKIKTIVDNMVEA